MTNLTFDNFQNEIINSDDKYINDKPTVMVFSALSWCQPCKQMHPIVEDFSNTYNGVVDIYEVDIEEEDDLTTKFGIRSVPTFVFIDKNGEQQRISGSMSKEKMKTYIESIIQ